MHEFGIIQGVFKLVEEAAVKNNLKAITKVTLKIGKLRQVFPDFLQFAFETVSKGTVAQDAKLVIVEVPIKMKCRTCQQEFAVERNAYICPKCNNVGLDVLSGKEIYIESIEGEPKDAD
jgi:hydrogenase nickel incorporation protein HypA/HybF